MTDKSAGKGQQKKDRPVLSSERAPHQNKTIFVKLISGHNWGSTPRLNWLIDRQSQCDFDFDLTDKPVVSWRRELGPGVQKNTGGRPVRI
jgi:hypothetical protein